jgi:hypothetical protein
VARRLVYISEGAEHTINGLRLRLTDKGFE